MANRSRVGFDDRDYYREPSRAPSRAPSRGPPVREYDDVDVRIRERERDRVPAFMREDRRAEPGPLVLRQREVETVDRTRRRSPSPLRVRETRIERARSVSPMPPRRVEEDVHIRTVERVREPSRGPAMERLRARIVERERSPSPEPDRERIRARIIERPRSPSPDIRERIRIVERERERPRPRSPSPPPAPEPQVVKGPVIEREVITHYRDIDHGKTIPVPLPHILLDRQSQLTLDRRRVRAATLATSAASPCE